MVTMALMVSVSSVVYVLEGVVPFPVPGGKWGFSNFLVLYLSYFVDLRSSVVLAASKSLLGSLLSGSFLTPGFFMGISGAVVAALTQRLSSRFKIFSITGVSLVGMVSNNVIQFLVGSFFIGSTALFIWLPVVFLFGTFSAVGNAFLASRTAELLRTLRGNEATYDGAKASEDE